MYIDLLTGGDNGLSVLVSTMCGKSVDLEWLCSRGHSVTGVELSPLAVEQFFKENSIPHTVTGVCGWGGLNSYNIAQKVLILSVSSDSSASLMAGSKQYSEQTSTIYLVGQPHPSLGI